MTIFDQVNELSKDLAPVLQRFHLRPSIKLVDGGYHIEFRDRARGLECPIAIELYARRGEPREKAVWDRGYFSTTYIEERKIGHNGWIAYTQCGRYSIQLPDKREDLVKEITEAIEYSGVIPDGTKHPNVTRFDAFADAYPEIEKAVKKLGPVQITCDRVGGAEIYSFQDPEGHGYSLLFYKDIVSLSVDQQRKVWLNAYEPEEIGKALRTQIRAMSRRQTLGLVRDPQ